MSLALALVDAMSGEPADAQNQKAGTTTSATAASAKVLVKKSGSAWPPRIFLRQRPLSRAGNTPKKRNGQGRITGICKARRAKKARQNAKRGAA